MVKVKDKIVKRLGVRDVLRITSDVKNKIKNFGNMKSNSLVATIIAALSVVIFALVLGNAYKFKYRMNNTINVTGNAKKDFESDIVKWSASYSRKSMDLSTASEQLKHDRELVRQFL